MSQYIIQNMNRAEVDTAISWANIEGWNPGLYDADHFFTADADGFLIGKFDGQPIATISAVKYGDGFGFIGFYIVKPEFRGQGYGLAIWNTALATLDGRNIGLDGVVAQQENYRKSGFSLAYRNIRFEGRNHGEIMNVVSPDNHIVSLAQVPFTTVLEYDRPFFPDNRDRFLKSWIHPPQGTALGFIDQNRLAGYGVIRRCQHGYKVGPLMADQPFMAEALFQNLVAATERGAAIFLDIPEVNPEAIALVKRHTMEPIFETARMYTLAAPELPLARLYGVTSFELG